MPQTIRPDDARLTWQGAISFRDTGEWRMPWRIPYEDRSLFPPDALRERAAMPAGVRLSFRSDTETVAGAVVPAVESSPIDLYCDGKFHGSAALEGRDGFRFDGLPAGEKLVELWLPQHGEFRLRHLEVSDGAGLELYDDRRPRWVAYGSSITHCRTAASPSLTWPAVAARACDLNLTCLGYGGGCHLEPMVAQMMRDLPADYLSMKVGINVYNAASIGRRNFHAGHHWVCAHAAREAPGHAAGRHLADLLGVAREHGKPRRVHPVGHARGSCRSSRATSGSR